MLPGPLTPYGAPATRTRRERFDALVVDVLHSLDRRWADQLAGVEFAVEEAPLLPEDWRAATVPLASLVRDPAAGHPRVVVFRRPIELRAETPEDLGALVLTVLVEQVAELLGRTPEEVDPRYLDEG